MDKISDKELFARVAADDERAFALFMERYKNRLYNFIFRIISEKEVADYYKKQAQPYGDLYAG